MSDQNRPKNPLANPAEMPSPLTSFAIWLAVSAMSTCYVCFYQFGQGWQNWWISGLAIWFAGMTVYFTREVVCLLLQAQAKTKS